MIINASKTKFFPFQNLSLLISSSHRRWVSATPSKGSPPPLPNTPHTHLSTFFNHPHRPSSEFALVSALKSCSSSSQAQQLHSLILKSGLDSNVFIHNSLINLYVKSGRVGIARSVFYVAPALDLASWNTMIGGYMKLGQVDDAQRLFDEMPERDCVSYTTMIKGCAENGFWVDALELFREMQVVGVKPNEVTMASVLPASVRLCGIENGKAIHGVVIKVGLEGFVLVSTNLVHLYAVCSRLGDAEFIFHGMTERTTVTWNVMLNGYTKCGSLDSAKHLFETIPVKDLFSWSTMIDGYVRANRLSEALVTYRKMQCAGVRPNEVTILDLVSACGQFSAIGEGRQFHAIILKSGLDSHAYIQAKIIHFYAACQQIDLAHLQFQLGDEDNISSWNALIAGLKTNNMVDSARRLFDKMPGRDVVSWSSMIAGYVQSGQYDLALDLFHDMRVEGLQPNEITMVSVVSAIAHSGNLKQGRWIHDYIRKNSVPLNDNLSAGLIDMYAKCGNIENALQLFHQVQDHISSISPWNAVICGLAMHGHANVSLSIFSDLQKTNIKPNSITFLGVLSACCHAGLVVAGMQYFESMKSVYDITPNIKHYGCMVDLLGRAGCLKEAQLLIESMPMKADVVIWGSMLAACKTHGNVEMGESAAENLSRLEPSHGAGQVLLSNIYAEAGRWDDVFLVRRAMQSSRLKRLPGCSGVV